MPSSLLRRSLLSLAGLAATVTFGFFITLAYLFSAGDYVVQPGSPAYYVGISSVVRSLELPRGALEREYYGTVGEGNKAPQSQLGFQVAHDQVAEAWDGMDEQLRRFGLRPASTTAGDTDVFTHGNTASVVPPMREARYLSTQDELVVLSAYASPDADPRGRVRFAITHFD